MFFSQMDIETDELMEEEEEDTAEHSIFQNDFSLNLSKPKPQS